MLTCKLDCLSLQAPGLLPMKGGISDYITLHQETHLYCNGCFALLVCRASRRRALLLKPVLH